MKAKADSEGKPAQAEPVEAPAFYAAARCKRWAFDRLRLSGNVRLLIGRPTLTSIDPRQHLSDLADDFIDMAALEDQRG